MRTGFEFLQAVKTGRTCTADGAYLESNNITLVMTTGFQISQAAGAGRLCWKTFRLSMQQHQPAAFAAAPLWRGYIQGGECLSPLANWAGGVLGMLRVRDAASLAEPDTPSDTCEEFGIQTLDGC